MVMSIIAYVGIDAHEKTLAICVLPREGNEPIMRTTLANDSITVRKFFAKLSETYELNCCYEASGLGYVIYRWLKELGISCTVIAPSLIPQRPGEVVKTDKRDAFKLASLFRAGQLTAVHVPTPDEEAVRQLVRHRDARLRDMVRTKNEINKFLTLNKLAFPGKSRWTQAHWKWLRGLRLDETNDFILTQLISILDFKIQHLTEVERVVELRAQTDIYKNDVALLCSFRGIKTITAMTLLTEIIDFERFRSPKALMAYLGLVPREFSSGEKRRQYGTTKAGNARCRRVLVEAVWKYAHWPALSADLKRRQSGIDPAVIAHSWKAQNRLYKKFRGLTERNKERGKAAVAVARELVGFLWSVLNKGANKQIRHLHDAALPMKSPVERCRV
jgi:transposase